jgi:phage terminase large subunit-like protein
VILSWDVALSEQEAGDYSAGVVLLNRGERYYVMEVVRGKFPFDRLKDKIIDMKQRATVEGLSSSSRNHPSVMV